MHSKIMKYFSLHPFTALLAMICILATGCSKNATDALIGESAQQIYFEMEYVNFAWGAQMDGIYIDRDGDIYQYDYGHSTSSQNIWQPNPNGLYTLAELQKKYQPNNVFVKHIPPDSLANKILLIKSASQGSLSAARPVGADIGKISLLCYVFDNETRFYRRIELAVRGDWEYENLTPEAAELVRWIDSLFLK